MNISRKLMIGLVAASAMMPVALMPHATYAQQYNAAYTSPNISVFNVDEVKKLAPGIDLDFTL